MPAWSIEPPVLVQPVPGGYRTNFRLPIAILFSLISCSLTACSVTVPMDDSRASQYSTVTSWYRAGGGSPVCGSALVVHGLNNRPEMMEPVIRVLNGLGYDALLVSLRGHRGSEGELAAAAAADWLGDIAAGFNRISAERRADKTVMLGFSIGGIAGLEYIKQTQPIFNPPQINGPQLDRIILLAPPLALSFRSSLIRFLIPGKHLNLALPSLTPPVYRVHDHTPLAAYDLSFSLIRSIKNDPGLAARSIPTSIFIAPGDEMVSLGGIHSLIKNHRLNNWSIHLVELASTIEPMYDHLIVDESSVGAVAWQKMTGQIAEAIGCHSQMEQDK